MSDTTSPTAVDPLDGLTEPELHARRLELMREIERLGGANSLDVPLDLVHQCLAITRRLRRGHAGPPRETRVKKPSVYNASNIFDF